MIVSLSQMVSKCASSHLTLIIINGHNAFCFILTSACLLLQHPKRAIDSHTCSVNSVDSNTREAQVMSLSLGEGNDT